MQFQKGFTIVELLVVITIIVVMLALLAPALDNAVYQAELALCGSKIHAVMSGAQTYAVGNKRQYPSSRRDISSERPAYSIKYPTGPDERTYLRTFLSLNDALNCPLRKKIDIETTRPQAAIYVGYALWFGFIYKAGTPERGMYKLGDHVGRQELRSADIRLCRRRGDGVRRLAGLRPGLAPGLRWCLVQ